MAFALHTQGNPIRPHHIQEHTQIPGRPADRERGRRTGLFSGTADWKGTRHTQCRAAPHGKPRHGHSGGTRIRRRTNIGQVYAGTASATR